MNFLLNYGECELFVFGFAKAFHANIETIEHIEQNDALHLDMYVFILYMMCSALSMVHGTMVHDTCV